MSKTTLSFLLVALMLVLGFGSFTALVLYGHWCLGVTGLGVAALLACAVE